MVPSVIAHNIFMKELHENSKVFSSIYITELFLDHFHAAHTRIQTLRVVFGVARPSAARLVCGVFSCRAATKKKERTL